MGSKTELTEKIKKIVRQVSGKVSSTDELFPEYCVRGTGIIFCLGADNRTFIGITRGISAYIVAEEFDTQMRTLVYTIHGDLVLIEPDELEELGFD
jgi:hypothetical protein|tara:strand:- start:3465 stop:3752 length:288 start_codon:yes stop_codon:yes gene_type:complete